jgi:hypothetical protein
VVPSRRSARPSFWRSLIVIAIIFLFLRDWRATIIPAVTLPVSLIGSFAAIWLAGFSVNILTLLALVLATGMVVDDAIVVLENIVRKRNEGMGVRARGGDRHPRGVLCRHHHHGDAGGGFHSRSRSCRGRRVGCSQSSASCWLSR